MGFVYILCVSEYEKLLKYSTQNIIETSLKFLLFLLFSFIFIFDSLMKDIVFYFNK